MSELKPCPFCGGMPKVNDWTLKGITDKRCFCDNEKCPVYLSKTIAIDDWNTRPIEDALQARIASLEAEIARRDEELLELNNDKAVFIKFENEDELPAEIKDDVYSAMFECSHVDGVRLFPYIEENGQKYFLVMLKEVV
jgi:hypothetical protein